jgi:hypothetical protein
MIKDAQALSKLDDDSVANVCKSVSKDVGQSIAEIATTKLKLACFWVRHQYWTLREIGGTQRPLVKIVYSGEIDCLREQKQEEDQWAAACTEPEYPLLTLDTSTATKAFDKVKTILGQTRGVIGVPLLYVIRVTLALPEDDNNDPAFGDEDSKYISIDMEMIARAPILTDEADTSNQDNCILEANGGIPQEELDKVTSIEACYYSPDEYAKFTPTVRQMHFQLMRAAKAAKSPAKTSSTSATVAELTTAVNAVSTAASAISELTGASTKCAATECEVTNDSDANDQPRWGCNRDNPAVAGHQEHMPKKTRT